MKSYIDTLLIYTHWYEFSNYFWCLKWFWPIFCLKKSTNLNHSYLKYALVYENVKEEFLDYQVRYQTNLPQSNSIHEWFVFIQ